MTGGWVNGAETLVEVPGSWPPAHSKHPGAAHLAMELGGHMGSPGSSIAQRETQCLIHFLGLEAGHGLHLRLLAQHVSHQSEWEHFPAHLSLHLHLKWLIVQGSQSLSQVTPEFYLL